MLKHYLSKAKESFDKPCMKDQNNVVHLAEFINNQEEIVSIEDNHQFKDLSVPDSNIIKRAIAFGIDLMAIIMVKSAIHVAYGVFINEFMIPVSYAKRLDLAMGPHVLHLLTFALIYTTYFLYTSFILNGKTLGKMTMKLRVINELYITDRKQESYELDLKASTKRAIGYLLCFLSFGVFFVFNFSSEDKRGLSDYLSGSRTVSDDWLTQFEEFKTHESEHVFIDIQDLDQVA